jgi:hypothetical protein
MALNETCSIQRDRETTQDSTLERLMQCLRLQDSTLDRLYTQATPNPWWERSGTPTPPTVCVQATVCPSSSTVRLPWMIRGSLNHGGAAMRVLASGCARPHVCTQCAMGVANCVCHDTHNSIVFVTTHLSRHTRPSSRASSNTLERERETGWGVDVGTAGWPVELV